ncbi:MAG: TRAP transporter small permease [Bacteroidota bacterium]
MKNALDRTLEALLVVLISSLTIVVLYQVGARYFFSNPSSVSEELARFLLIWLGLFGAAYALGKQLHLAITLLPDALPPTSKRWLNIVIQLFIVLFTVFVLIWGGTLLVSLTLETEQTSAALGVKLGYVYTALPLSGIVMLLYASLNIYAGWTSQPINFYDTLNKEG